eukprot:Amastigsp_a340486_119.p2 type:complete len:251 gc:universal Amastigsp_a340486_119:174-926(+)
MQGALEVLTGWCGGSHGHYHELQRLRRQDAAGAARSNRTKGPAAVEALPPRARQTAHHAIINASVEVRFPRLLLVMHGSPDRRVVELLLCGPCLKKHRLELQVQRRLCVLHGTSAEEGQKQEHKGGDCALRVEDVALDAVHFLVTVHDVRQRLERCAEVGEHDLLGDESDNRGDRVLLERDRRDGKGAVLHAEGNRGTPKQGDDHETVPVDCAHERVKLRLCLEHPQNTISSKTARERKRHAAADDGADF